MVAREFFHQEREYEAFLKGGGFVCNGIGMGPSWHRVHRTDCTILNHAGPARPGARTTVKKLCDRNLTDLVAALGLLYGREGVGFQYCAFCRPQDG